MADDLPTNGGTVAKVKGVLAMHPSGEGRPSGT